MRLKRWFQISLILTPLLIGLLLLLFSIFTEYWYYTDNSVIIKNQRLIDTHLNSLYKNSYRKRLYRIKFYKFGNYFSTCYDYKWINVLDTVQNVTQSSQASSAEENINYDDVIDNACLSNRNECLTKPCFCCKTNSNCCFDASKKCNFIADCLDESDEVDLYNNNANAECHAIKTTSSIKYYDKLNLCYRYKYNYIDYLKQLFKEKLNSNETKEIKIDHFDEESKYELLTMKLNLLSLFSFLLCAFLTIICLFTLLFVRCCSYRKDSILSAKTEYYDNYYNNKKRATYLVTSNSSDETTSAGHKYRKINMTIDESINNEDDYDIDNTSKCNCCKCTYYLCPFIFYTIFTFIAFALCSFGLGLLFYQIYLIYQNNQSNYLYKLNTWLNSIYKLGLSFYTLCAAWLFYGVTFLFSIYVTCRIQMSPEWKSRYSDVYEVSQMQQILPQNQSTSSTIISATSPSSSSSKIVNKKKNRVRL